MLVASMADGQLPIGDCLGIIRSSATRFGKFLFGASKFRLGVKSFEHVSKYGIDTYKVLYEKLGTGYGLEVHHLIEKKFAKILGVKPNEMKSIVLTPNEHSSFTRAWSKMIGYRNHKKKLLRTDNVNQIYDAAKEIYRDYPDILKALGLN